MSQRAADWIGLVLFLAGLIYLGSINFVKAHDHDHPELDAWYATLMQPDNPSMSCCGKADAYWCDDYYFRDYRAFCKITDDRTVPGRPHIPVGTEIEIPNHKLKWDRGNPTGHAVVFVSPMLHVFCFVQGFQT
jgi:hypothetical protein